jgi:molybdate transport system ATP-binding protein
VNAEALLEVEAHRRVAGFELNVAFSSHEARTVIFGPSGGGKSMTLRAIAGAVRLDGGRIVVGGRILYDSAAGINLASHQRRVGYVPQGYGLFPHLTVGQNILYGSRREAGDRRELLARLLQLTDLVGMEGRRPSEISGGQQQRVALARALAAEPSLLLLDEPFSALDASRRRSLRDELIDLQRRTAVPLITVTHDLQDAFELGDRIVIIDRGRVLQEGTREEVFYRPSTRRAAELLGMRNLLQARVITCAEGIAIVDWYGLRLEAATSLPLQAWQTVFLGVRPSQLTIRRPEDELEGRRNALPGRIVSEVVTPEGYRLLFQADNAPDSRLEIELSGYTYFRLGLDTRKQITVTIRPEALHTIVA